MANCYFNILLFGISGGEILVVFLFILILFGPKKIPEIARVFGKGISEFRRVQREINMEINRYSSEVEKQAGEVQSEIDKMVSEKPSITESDDQKAIADSSREIPEASTEDDLPYPYNQKTGNS